MDHNLDLLTINHHKDTRVFLDLMLDIGLIPTITCPTRITHSSANLIDNVFIGGSLQRNFELSIIISDISDHLLLLLLKQTKVKDKTSLEFENRNLTEKNTRPQGKS